MSDNFFKVKNGLNLPTLAADPTVTPPANSVAGDMAFFNGKLYIYNGTAWGIKPGSGSTGLIVNADVDASAAIEGSKIVAASASVPGVVTTGAQTLAGIKTFSSNPVLSAMTTAGVVHNAAGTGALTSSLIVDADVDASAAIAGTKVNPSFGSQNISTSGTISAVGNNSKLTVTANSSVEAVYIEQAGAGNALVVADQANDSTVTVIDASGNMGVGVAANAALTEKLTVAGDVKVTTGDIKLDTAKGIESSAASSTLNIGTGTNTQVLNLGTGSGTQTVNIGTGAGTTTINIGATGDSVVISGTLTTVNTTNLDVADKNITLNKGGLAGSANGSGISIEAGGSSVASITFDQTDGGSQPQNTFLLSGTGSLALPSGTTSQRPNTPANGMIRYNSTNGAFEGYASNAWSGIGGGGTIDKVTQASHGFVVGDVLYINGGNYAKAQADTAVKAEVVGMVSRVIDSSTFELTLNGEVSGLTGLTMGEAYFLSASTAGAITATEPSVVGQISLPVGVASSTTTLYVAPKRGSVVGGANLRTQIGLTNNSTTNVQNVGDYDAGSIEGWVYIDATTDYRFHVRANFAKNGLGNDYNLSYQTTGDTPPAGFSMGITNAGVITATLPNVSGFSSASINFALNAPAVGATLPLQIASTSVSFDTIQAKDVNGISVKNAAGSATNVFVSNAGNVGIGTTSPSVSDGKGLVINGGAGQARIALKNNATGDGADDGLQLAVNNSSDAFIYQYENAALVFGTNAAERGRINAAGAWTLGPSGASMFKTSGAEITVSTTFVNLVAMFCGIAIVSAYNTSGGAQGTWLVAFTSGGAPTVIGSLNNTGLTVSFQHSSGNLQMKTASGTLGVFVQCGGF